LGDVDWSAIVKFLHCQLDLLTSSYNALRHTTSPAQGIDFDDLREIVTAMRGYDIHDVIGMRFNPLFQVEISRGD
jgi:hypothetical protein